MTTRYFDDCQEYSLYKIKGYLDWSKNKLHTGESPDIFAHLDGITLWISPGDMASLTDIDFEEMLSDLKDDLKK